MKLIVFTVLLSPLFIHAMNPTLKEIQSLLNTKKLLERRIAQQYLQTYSEKTNDEILACRLINKQLKALNPDRVALADRKAIRS
jgi:hypothetical protein